MSSDVSDVRNLIVIGSGPAGCAAALDAERFLAAREEAGEPATDAALVAGR